MNQSSHLWGFACHMLKVRGCECGKVFLLSNNTLSGIQWISPLMWAKPSFTLCALNWCQSHQTTCISFHFSSIFLVCRSWAYLHTSFNKETVVTIACSHSLLFPWLENFLIWVSWHISQLKTWCSLCTYSLWGGF